MRRGRSRVQTIDFDSPQATQATANPVQKPPQTGHTPSERGDEGKGSRASSSAAVSGEFALVDDAVWLDSLKEMLERDALGYVHISETRAAVEWWCDKRYGAGQWRLALSLSDADIHKLMKTKGLKFHEESGCLSLIQRDVRLTEARRVEAAKRRGIRLPSKFPKGEAARLKMLEEIGV